MFPSGFPVRGEPARDPEAQIFADLGFAVVRLNHRSDAGVSAEDVTPLRAAVDRVLVDDGWATIEWIAARNPDRVFDCLGYPTDIPTDENTHLQATQLRAELAAELARPPTAP